MSVLPEDLWISENIILVHQGANTACHRTSSTRGTSTSSKYLYNHSYPILNRSEFSWLEELTICFNCMATSKESSAELRPTMAISSSFRLRSIRIFEELRNSTKPQDQRDRLIVTRQGKCGTGLVRTWFNFRHGEHGCCSIERPFFAISFAIAQEMYCIVIIVQFATNDRRFCFLLPHCRH